MRSERPPLFSSDVAVSLDGDGNPGLSVVVSVPFSELHWLRETTGYAAAVEMTVSFDPSRGGRLYGDSWEQRVRVPTFAGTLSGSAALNERRTFQVAPGRYDVRVRLRDAQSGEESWVRDRIVVPDYSKVSVGFGDLELGLADSVGGFTAVPTRRYGQESQRLAARATLFDRRPGDWPRRYPFRVRVLDEQGGEVAANLQEVELSRSAEPIVLRSPSPSLFLGRYTFEVELAGEGRQRWRVDRPFEIEESGPPTGRDFERMLEVLSYIADSREVESLRDLPSGDRERGWEEFWARRDPTPDTPRNEAMIEFFRRVRYAEQHFQGFGPGWRSDMGRIYIKYGPPDQVEARPATSSQRPRELWFYHQPYRVFEFEDKEGFGRYSLLNPILE
jgi:GWxTD domain-containing protein